QPGAATRVSRQSVSVVRIMAPFLSWRAREIFARSVAARSADGPGRRERARSRTSKMARRSGEADRRQLIAHGQTRHAPGSFPGEQAMALELSLEDIRRAWDSRDPELSTLIVSLAGAADPRPDKPPREGAL